MSYLVSSLWRGALHICAMRLFEDETEARQYYEVCTENDEARMYLLFNDKPPKLILPEKGKK